jgi:hypothetical protein
LLTLSLALPHLTAKTNFPIQNYLGGGGKGGGSAETPHVPGGEPGAAAAAAGGGRRRSSHTGEAKAGGGYNAQQHPEAAWGGVAGGPHAARLSYDACGSDAGMPRCGEEQGVVVLLVCSLLPCVMESSVSLARPCPLAP